MLVTSICVLKNIRTHPVTERGMLLTVGDVVPISDKHTPNSVANGNDRPSSSFYLAVCHTTRLVHHLAEHLIRISLFFVFSWET